MRPCLPTSFPCASLVRTALPLLLLRPPSQSAQRLSLRLSQKSGRTVEGSDFVNTGNSVRVDEISPTPIKGIYEVLSEGKYLRR